MTHQIISVVWPGAGAADRNTLLFNRHDACLSAILVRTQTLNCQCSDALFERVPKMRNTATLIILTLAVLCTASLACNSVQLKDDLCGNGSVVTGMAFSEQWGLSSGLLVVPPGKQHVAAGQLGAQLSMHDCNFRR